MTLDKKTTTLLKCFDEYESLSMEKLSIKLDCNISHIDKEICFLHNIKYIEKKHIDNDNSIMLDTDFSITPYGRAYLEKYTKSLKIHKLNLFFQWGHFALTIISLIIAIIALLK